MRSGTPALHRHPELVQLQRNRDSSTIYPLAHTLHRFNAFSITPEQGNHAQNKKRKENGSQYISLRLRHATLKLFERQFREGEWCGYVEEPKWVCGRSPTGLGSRVLR